MRGWLNWKNLHSVLFRDKPEQHDIISPNSALPSLRKFFCQELSEPQQFASFWDQEQWEYGLKRTEKCNCTLNVPSFKYWCELNGIGHNYDLLNHIKNPGHCENNIQNSDEWDLCTSAKVKYLWNLNLFCGVLNSVLSLKIRKRIFTLNWQDLTALD